MGFDRLNHDCLRAIVEFVDDTSPQTIRKALRFVNKELHALCRLVGHRRKVLEYPQLGYNFQDPSLQDLGLSAWLEDDNILRALHHLSIKSVPDLVYDHGVHSKTLNEKVALEDAKFSDLAALISKVGNLRILDWNYHGRVPLQILEALQRYHPCAELRVWNFSRIDDAADHTDPAELALAKSKALTAIKARFWPFAGRVDTVFREAALKRIVGNAPNLRLASISRGRGAGYVSDELPEELDELANKFLTNQMPNKSLKSLTLDGYMLNEQTLREWGKVTDLSRLESLQCSRGMPDANYFTYSPQVLTNLKRVSLNLTTADDSLKGVVQTYISEMSPLESLSVWSWMKWIPLHTILSRHGQSLRTLQLHERETTASFGQERRRIVSLADLNTVHESCPNLRDFTVDLDRRTRDLNLEDEWEQYGDKIQTLANMNLDRLQIYYDLGIASLFRLDFELDDDDNQGSLIGTHNEEETHAEQPSTVSDLINSPPRKKRKTSKPQFLLPSPNQAIEPFIAELWRTIFAHRPSGKSRVLDVKFGEYEKTSGADTEELVWRHQEEEMKTWWTVVAEERDDRVGECVVTKRGRGLEEGVRLYGRNYGDDEEHEDDEENSQSEGEE